MKDMHRLYIKHRIEPLQGRIDMVCLVVYQLFGTPRMFVIAKYDCVLE